jgi:hypothetical protein
MGYSMEQVIEEGRIANAEQMLEALMEKDSTGLTLNRKPDDRLLLACHHHAILLASILRYKDIPVRIRFGFARYFEKEAGVRFGHVICEVWNEKEQRWMLVDPDRNYVDFSARRFDFADEAWNNLRRQRLDPEVYVSSIGGKYKGVVSILGLDIAHVLHKERMNWVYPKVALKDITDFNDLTSEEWETLKYAAVLLENPDRNYHLLDSVYKSNLFLQASDFTYEDYCEMMERD